MSDGYAEFIEDCRSQRAQLIGLIEAMENGSLAVGTTIVVPDSLAAVTAVTVSGFKRTITELNALIEAWDDSPKD
jgi:hypothetical protein